MDGIVQNKLLVIRPGAIGDFLVSLPALERLRPDEIWCAEANVPLAWCARRVHSIGSTGLNMLEIDPPPRLLERLRGFARIVSWYGTARPEFRAASAGLPFEFLPALPAGGLHACDFYWRQVGGSGPAPAPRLPLPPAPPRRVIVIHPFASAAAKRWPLDRFQELAARLPLPVDWCAGPEEPLPGAVRFDDLGALAHWLSGAALYVGNDSGIAHLAAAAGVPVAAIFGPTDPAVWAPRGDRVAVIPAPGGDLRSLTVAAVLEQLEVHRMI